MSFLSRSASRLLCYSAHFIPKEIGTYSLTSQSQHSIRQLTRSLVVLSNPTRTDLNKKTRLSLLCSCGCGINGMHTKGDKELSEFLVGEISAEKKNHMGPIPSKLNDFTIKQVQAELLLTKQFHDEEVTISLNVNHTVDSDVHSEQGSNEEENLKSRPDFEVDLKIGSNVLSFTCQFNPPVEQEGGEEDVFGISEVTLYKGEWEENMYCVSGDILDGVMYDLLMNMLEERGINGEFAEKMSELATNYEHGLYIGLLENLQNFVQRK